MPSDKRSLFSKVCNIEEQTKLQTVVHMHPLVLLSAVDHFSRINNCISGGKRVVGILLGTQRAGCVEVTNSYAVPFEEDPHDHSVWFFDKTYAEDMFWMFKKVWSATNIVGWYSSGPKIGACDLEVNRIIEKFCQTPVYCIIEVNPRDQGIPATCYIAHTQGDSWMKSTEEYFAHLYTEIKSIEGESIGIEQLLRDLTSATAETLEAQTSEKKASLRVLQDKLKEIDQYVIDVKTGLLKGDAQVFNNIKHVHRLLSRIEKVKNSVSMKKEFHDSAIGSYVGKLVQSVISVADIFHQRSEIKAASRDA